MNTRDEQLWADWFDEDGNGPQTTIINGQWCATPIHVEWQITCLQPSACIASPAFGGMYLRTADARSSRAGWQRPPISPTQSGRGWRPPGYRRRGGGDAGMSGPGSSRWPRSRGREPAMANSYGQATRRARTWWSPWPIPEVR